MKENNEFSLLLLLLLYSYDFLMEMVERERKDERKGAFIL
jgi:hypothetical protein